MPGIAKGIHGVAFSPDGRRALAAGADNHVQFWDLETGLLLFGLEGHSGMVTHAVFSTDGCYALSGGSDGTLRLWRMPKSAKAPPSSPPTGNATLTQKPASK
jgi:WD40 repeat protein